MYSEAMHHAEVVPEYASQKMVAEIENLYAGSGQKD